MPLSTHRNTLEPHHLSLDQVREEKGPLSCLQWQWCFTAFTSKRKETGEVLKYRIQESCLNTLNLNLQTQHFWLPVLPSQKNNNEINILPLPPFNQVPNILSFKSCPECHNINSPTYWVPSLVFLSHRASWAHREGLRGSRWWAPPLEQRSPRNVEGLASMATWRRGGGVFPTRTWRITSPWD